MLLARLCTLRRFLIAVTESLFKKLKSEDDPFHFSSDDDPDWIESNSVSDEYEDENQQLEDHKKKQHSSVNIGDHMPVLQKQRKICTKNNIEK